MANEHSFLDPRLLRSINHIASMFASDLMLQTLATNYESALSGLITAKTFVPHQVTKHARAWGPRVEGQRRQGPERDQKTLKGIGMTYMHEIGVYFNTPRMIRCT